MKVRIFLLSVAFTACSSGGRSTVQGDIPGRYKINYETGKVMENVKCLKDTTISYSLYLPSGYDTVKALPLLVFFDAEARGRLAVHRLKKVAEKLGFIVAGSNNARNGLDQDRYDYITATTLEDLNYNLAINGKRVYTAGFSGGARQAMLLALKRGDIAGVIGCSAGMPQWDQPLPSNFFYIGMAGFSDFNYGEMVNLKQKLASSSLPHEFIYRDGIHEMPSAEDFENAVTLLQINAMMTKATERNEDVITYFIQLMEKNISKLKKKNMLFDVYLNYHILVKQLSGITDVSAYRAKLTEMEQNVAVVISKNKYQENIVSESNQRQSLSAAFKEKGMDWWKKQINKLHAGCKMKSDPYFAFMNRRLLAYIALAAHMHYDAAVQEGNSEKERFFLDLKILAEPSVSMGYYLFAVYYAREGNQEKSFQMMKKAVALGFNDENKFFAEPLLSWIRNSDEATSLMDEIKKNYLKDLNY